jgi:hypothetical protein
LFPVTWMSEIRNFQWESINHFVKNLGKNDQKIN